MAGELVFQTSPVAAFLDALCERLRARPDFEGVEIYSAVVPTSELRGDTVMFDSVDERQEWGTLGNFRREHTWATTIGVLCKRPGKDEPTIRAVRARAYEIAGLIERELRQTNYGVQVASPTGEFTARVAWVGSIELDQFATAEGRWCALTVTVQAEATTVLR